ncbi:MAG: hypothetical protein WD970_01120 [Patescibacteria group bacterium]
MNKPLTWWVGLTLFVLGGLAVITPPEYYPGWYQRVWGVTHPYKTDATLQERKAPAIFGQIWVGRGEKGVGGNTRLEFEQPALRREAADADARVDGRARHMGWMGLVAMIGLLLMILGFRQEERERDDRRFEHLGHQPPTPKDQSAQPTLVLASDNPSNPLASESPDTDKPPLEAVNDDPEPKWWQRLFGRSRRHDEHRRQRHMVAAPPEPIKIIVVVESFDDKDKSKARHVLTADLPPMTVHTVNAHLKVGSENTIQQMDLDVH